MVIPHIVQGTTEIKRPVVLFMKNMSTFESLLGHEEPPKT